MASAELEQAKRIATDGLSFRIPAERGLFPPRDVANSFFACGYDDRAEEAVLEWEPFELSEDEYRAFWDWWQATHAAARVDRLGVPGSDFRAWFAAAVRSQTLEYARPTRRPPPRFAPLRFWGAFLLGGVIGVPAGEAAVSAYFREPPLSFGGLILSTVCLLVAAGGIAVARTAMPRWFGSPVAALAAGLFGPVAGLALFCVLVL